MQCNEISSASASCTHILIASATFKYVSDCKLMEGKIYFCNNVSSATNSSLQIAAHSICDIITYTAQRSLRYCCTHNAILDSHDNKFRMLLATAATVFLGLQVIITSPSTLCKVSALHAWMHSRIT